MLKYLLNPVKTLAHEASVTQLFFAAATKYFLSELALELRTVVVQTRYRITANPTQHQR